jgi:hypothetical protein
MMIMMIMMMMMMMMVIMMIDNPASTNGRSSLYLYVGGPQYWLPSETSAGNMRLIPLL